MPPEVLDALGPWGQFGLLVTSIGLILTGFARGWLRPSSSVDRELKPISDRMADKDEIIKELKATNAALMATNKTNADSIRELVELGRTSNAALAALPRVGVDRP